jgi:predicted RNase H-like HicB family nuclease
VACLQKQISPPFIPSLGGCYNSAAVADTREEVEQLMKEALQEHLQMMREEHLPLPQSQTEAEYMDIPLSA